MHSARNRSHSPQRTEGEAVIEAARLLIDSAGNSRITDEIRLNKCSLLLRKAPATRSAVLDTIMRCIERNVLHLPAFKKNLNDIRHDRYNKGFQEFFMDVC